MSWDGDSVIEGEKNGRYGPYTAVGKTNYRILRELSQESLTLADCKKLLPKHLLSQNEAVKENNGF
jgi:topoisomerase IA-like protein